MSPRTSRAGGSSCRRCASCTTTTPKTRSKPGVSRRPRRRRALAPAGREARAAAATLRARRRPNHYRGRRARCGAGARQYEPHPRGAGGLHAVVQGTMTFPPGQDRLDLAPARSSFAALPVRGLISPAHSPVPAQNFRAAEDAAGETLRSDDRQQPRCSLETSREDRADGPLLGLGDARVTSAPQLRPHRPTNHARDIQGYTQGGHRAPTDVRPDKDHIAENP